MTVKQGFKTTEFLATVLVGVGSVAAALAGDLAPRYAAIASTISVAAYSLSRAITKYGAFTATRPIVSVPATTTTAAGPV